MKNTRRCIYKGYLEGKGSLVLRSVALYRSAKKRKKGGKKKEKRERKNFFLRAHVLIQMQIF